MHKECVLSFYSDLICDASGIVTVLIPTRLWNESDVSFGSFSLVIGSNSDAFRFTVPAEFSPLATENSELAQTDPVVHLGEKIGFNIQQLEPSVRLFEVVESYRQKSGLFSGVIPPEIMIFIDDSDILLFVHRSISVIFTASEIPITVSFPSRIIRAIASVKGVLELNRVNSIYRLGLVSIQEEDRRFLYEQCYRRHFI